MLRITNSGFVPQKTYENELMAGFEKLKMGNGEGGEYTGWVYLPREYDKNEFEQIKIAAEEIKRTSDVLVVIGIGGSYLGARAVIELLKSPNYNLMKKETPDIFFAGNTLSSDSISETIELIGDRDFSINVISKSGSTTEPAVAFRIFRELLVKKYGRKEAGKRIYVTTDKARGALKGLADEEGWKTFVIPDEIGGRYSVLTAVGLLPIAVAGIDIERLMSGASAEMERTMEEGVKAPAARYAALRNELYENGKKIEILGCFEPAFRFFAEWWKQLYGESEGKDCKGIFPASVEFTADLHSMGQYIQQGERSLLETIVVFERPRNSVMIPKDDQDGDGLNFLIGKDLQFVSEQARRGTLLAHVDGGVPNLIVTVSERKEEDIGGLIYFFEFACGLSGYLLGVNPFDQPGVEAYKKNMFALLGKPGYEEERTALERRLS